MIGAIIGDIVGSVYEFNPTNRYDFAWITPRSSFTDDTVCTIAVADAAMNGRDYGETLYAWCRRYPCPMGGYGGRFLQWVHSDNPQPYNSLGNGSAMRVASIGWLFTTEEEVLEQAKRSAECTHNHQQGIAGAQAVALAIFLARNGATKEQIIERMATFGFSINGRTLEDYRNRFDETCGGTIPAAMLCLQEATDFESAVRLAVSLGADADTLGAIVGGIAEALWGISEDIRKPALARLPEDIRNVVSQFNKQTKRYE